MIRLSTIMVPALLLLSTIGLTRPALGINQAPAADSQRELEDELRRQRDRIQELERLVRQQGDLLEALQRQIAGLPQSGNAGPDVGQHPAQPVPALAVASSGGASPQPLSFRIGSAHLTPIGFLDFTAFWRSTGVGSGIGTSFGAIPYRNTPAGELSEFRLSAQNSRIGSRIDAIVKGTRVTGYWESDFLGFVPGNAAVSTNSDTFRLRLYWVDLRKGKWEVLAGQSWSLITPGRSGISPFPADLFYSQDIDTNYQAGLTWSRDPQLRVVYHPSPALAAAVSFESPEQYIGGSAGGGPITLPSSLVTAYQSELNNGSNAFGVPNRFADVVGKLAFDPRVRSNRSLHLEIGGTARTFRTWNLSSVRHFTATGLGVQANMNFELFKGFRVLTNHYWSDGGGRWIFGQAPDVIVRADGSLSPVHSGSIVSGLEYTNGNTLMYGYYGGVYIGRSVAVDSSGRLVGYGYPGAPPGQNRSIQEVTFGLNRTLWKSGAYGALTLMAQYSYLVRNPWWVSETQPRNARSNMMFVNLRYAMPGAAPMLK